MRVDVYWIEGPWRGRLGIVPRPRGGDWLEEEIQAWRKAGIDIVNDGEMSKPSYATYVKDRLALRRRRQQFRL